ncbi:hypothetical protein SAMN05216559_0748 [Halomicrobium zhouii]|uniref:Oligosaccharide repeat unit polymerase n=1 Tax=Halomicrobium zhouii TaxID=767519 RepID=A0A1I6KGF5_9EURY|nr:hypothetical protein [Halomicrobium zhouii]SFR90118.1 hypothetical protein SAMN05216559_0748 [Halomicrobium zhouii]
MTELTLRRPRLAELRAYGLLVITLSTFYVGFVALIFTSSGFTATFDLYRLSDAIFLLSLSYLVLPKSGTKPSTSTVQMIMVFLITPTILYYAFNGGARAYIYTAVLGFILTCIVIRIPPDRKIKQLSISRWQFGLFIFAVSGIVYVALLFGNGLPTLTAIDIRDVYEVRGSVTVIHPVLNYLVPWQANVINPFLIGKSIIEKRYKLLVIACGLQLYLYLLFAHKMFLFMPLLLIVSLLLIANRNFLSGICRGISLGSVFAWLVYFSTGLLIVPSILIRRLFFVQPRNQFYYFEYFSRNPFAYYSNSKVGILFQDVYSTPLPLIIGEEYTGAFANVGYIAGSYAQLGLTGIIVGSVALGALLWLTDVLTWKYDPLSVSIIVTSFFNIINSSLTTSILTHGIAFSLFLVYLHQSAEADHSYNHLVLTSSRNRKASA